MNIKDKISEGYILARIIIEVMGSPADYIEKSLKLAIDAIKEKEKDIELIKEEYFAPEEKDKMFSTFTELEILFKNLPLLVNFCFEYTPSSVEILDPQDLNYKSREFANHLNDLLGRIHHTSMNVINYTAENKLLKKNAASLLQNIVLLSLREKDKNLNELSNDIGINEEKLKKIVENFVEQKIIIKNGDKYAKKKN